MKVAFVDDLIFIPCPKVNFDRQPSRGEFLFLLKKLKEIRSRLVCVKNTHLTYSTMEARRRMKKWTRSLWKFRQISCVSLTTSSINLALLPVSHRKMRLATPLPVAHVTLRMMPSCIWRSRYRRPGRRRASLSDIWWAWFILFMAACYISPEIWIYDIKNHPGVGWFSYGEKIQFLVRMKGLEPSRREAHAPKACVSTNSTTSA